MAVAIDASSPVAVTGTSTAAITTASFTPPASAIIVAIANTGNSTGSGAQSGTITDSLSGAWTSIIAANTTDQGTVQAFRRDVGGSPAAMTVTWAPSGTNGKGSQLDVWVITGAGASGAAAIGATASAVSATAGQISIMPVATGSLLFMGLTYTDTGVTLTANGVTTSDKATVDSTNGETYAAAHLTGTTTTTAATSVGYTVTGLDNVIQMVGVEVKASGTSAPSVGSSATSVAAAAATMVAGALGSLQFLIPLYIYPTTGTFWADLAANPRNVAYVVANPASGPGTSANADYVTGINNLRTAGIKVLGYVDTSYGAIALTGPGSVETQMDSWANWYSIDGYFFDRANNIAGGESYYATLNTYAKSKSAAYITVNNYGTTCPSSYYSTCDINVNTEESETQLQSNFEPLAGWEAGNPTNHFAQIIYSCTSANLSSDLATLLGRNTYYVWLAEDALYQTEPSYWPTLQGMVGAAPSLGPTARSKAVASALLTVPGVQLLSPVARSVSGARAGVVVPGPANVVAHAQSVAGARAFLGGPFHIPRTPVSAVTIAMPVGQWATPLGYWRALPGASTSDWSFEASGIVDYRGPTSNTPATPCVDAYGNLFMYPGVLQPGMLVPGVTGGPPPPGATFTPFWTGGTGGSGGTGGGGGGSGGGGGGGSGGGGGGGGTGGGGGGGGAGGSEVQFQAYTTVYGWWDNTPPGSSDIAFPASDYPGITLHNLAGGVGTYADPASLAVGWSLNTSTHVETPDFPAGTRFYVPNMRHYFIVEDECGDYTTGGTLPQFEPCHSLTQAPAGSQIWIDMWGGGQGVTSGQSDTAENNMTPDVPVLVIQNPNANYSVVSGDLITLYRNGTIPSNGFGNSLVLA
jgi:hypothetical protein